MAKIVDKDRVVEVLRGLGTFRALEGETFKASAYNNAAETLAELPEQLSEIRPIDLDGFGQSICSKIREITETGTCALFEDYRKKYPGLIELTAVRGIGPKTAFKLWKDDKVRSIDALKKKLESGKIDRPKLLEAVNDFLTQDERVRLIEVLPKLERLLARIRSWGAPLVQAAEFAGSVRRQKETVGDCDIIVATKRPQLVNEKFVALAKHKSAEVVAAGDKKTRIILPLGGGRKIQVDLLTVDPSHYGAALLYFTGSKEHNIAMRNVAIKMGLKLNEYGLFFKKTNKRVDSEGLSERSIYKVLGLVWHPPTLREGGRLTTLKDVRG